MVISFWDGLFAKEIQSTLMTFSFLPITLAQSKDGLAMMHGLTSCLTDVSILAISFASPTILVKY